MKRTSIDEVISSSSDLSKIPPIGKWYVNLDFDCQACMPICDMSSKYIVKSLRFLGDTCIFEQSKDELTAELRSRLPEKVCVELLDTGRYKKLLRVIELMEFLDLLKEDKE